MREFDKDDWTTIFTLNFGRCYAYTVPSGLDVKYFLLLPRSFKKARHLKVL